MGKRRSEQIMVHFYKGKRRETEVTEMLWIYTCTCKHDMFTCTCKHDMYTCTCKHDVFTCTVYTCM